MVVVLGASLRVAKAGGCCPTVVWIDKLLREMLVAGLFMAVVVCRQYGDIVRKSWGATTGVMSTLDEAVDTVPFQTCVSALEVRKWLRVGGALDANGLSTPLVLGCVPVEW